MEPSIDSQSVNDFIAADWGNPELLNPELLNPELLNPELLNPELLNPDLPNPDLPNPDLPNPDLPNPDRRVQAPLFEEGNNPLTQEEVDAAWLEQVEYYSNYESSEGGY
jgi:hypothetical protein